VPKSWKQITDDEILDYDDAHTGQVARYERIMQHRSNVEMHNLSRMLQGVMETIHTTAQLVSDKADVAMQKYDEAAREQKKQQTAMKWLTTVLAVATVCYTAINGVAVYQSWRANELQAQAADARSTRAGIRPTDPAKQLPQRPPAVTEQPVPH
jgi:hypothetical protein